MSSSSKRKKGPQELNVGHEDRISNLPTSLITKILSCLPTKDAVMTSVLSTKWKRSWVYVTNLDFEDVTNYPYDLESDSPTFRKFTSFVHRVLLLRDKSSLQKFSLKGYHDYDGSFINAWLVVVLQCNVQELDISISIKHPGILPSEVFVCNTLVILKLSAFGSLVNMSTSARLPSLRTLHLVGVHFSDQVSITKILSDCPVLEELKLKMCKWEAAPVVNIIAPSLKKLIIKDLQFFEEYQIVIDTRSLLYFDVRDDSGKLCVVNMDHLIEAKINIDCYFGFGGTDHQFQEIHSDNINNFVHKIFQVQRLILSIESVLTISKCNPALPIFSKLTYLELNESGDREWKFLPKLLKNSPYLETLNIKQGHEGIGKEDCVPLPFHEVPCCFLSHLKKVEIGLFEYFEDEMDIVKYILKNAKVLNKLTLHYYAGYYSDYPGYSSPAERHDKFLKELLSFPRASSICEVVVCD